MNARSIWTKLSRNIDVWTNAYHKRPNYRSKWKRDSLDIPQRNLKKKKKKWNLVSSPICDCGLGNQTMAHIKCSKRAVDWLRCLDLRL